MAHAVVHRAFDQGAGVHRIVAIIGERVAHRFGNHDRRGEVDDGLDPILTDQARDQGLVAAVAGDQRHAFRDRP